ncbi:MAG: UDP-N-acetylglucosamine--N-acetylmuramyl-(pentapeptide) pyrophosphoryl-undecaprenol N-acetylglucosamine transferase, partial [Muribaculaceae bacterium]|nr:UDP-N-acetylglucosamine--N-acetylmuramyl-(pentapeptide) pyrophosphoryl-undecaprenol N-acetylglucosamine transferase [Muribaculaceae bacterium]
NSYAGVTNKLLGEKAACICVAYDNMDRFFPREKIVKTGNPIRKALLNDHTSVKEARESFGLNPDLPTLLVVGGSLGALTINESIEAGISRLADKGIQVIWQTGKNFGDRGPAAVKRRKGIVVTPFITDMAAAYKAADLVIGRAGAGSISELQVLGKPVILVPSPNVAEDHQTHNARALSDVGAAVFVADADARQILVDEAIRLMGDPETRKKMSNEIKKMAISDSDTRIANEVCDLLKIKK